METIQSLWIGDTLSAMERMSITSFLSYGHEYHLYTYGPVRNVPDGVIIKDGNEIMPYFRCNSIAAFSDFFRIKLLLDRGGWWADLDMICLQSLDKFTEDYVFAEEASQGDTRVVASCFYKAPAGSRLMKYMRDVCLKTDPFSITWGDIGPKLITEMVTSLNLWKYVHPPHRFCPVNWFDWTQIVDKDKTPCLSSDSFTVHLWNEMWRRKSKDKNSQHPTSCLYEKLKRRYRSVRFVKSDAGKVSIIIPLYNQAQYVSDAIESALMQTYRDFEIIVVNDGSTDNAIEVVTPYCTGVVKLITQKNAGLSAARNAGIAASTGEFILPLDADDLIDETFLEKTVPLMKDDVGIVATDLEFFEKDESYWSVRSNIDLKTLLRSNQFACCSLIRRQAFIDAGGYRSEMNLGFEDWCFWIDVMKHGWTAAVINEPLFKYRVRENSMSTGSNQNFDIIMQQLRAIHSELYEEYNIPFQPRPQGRVVIFAPIAHDTIRSVSECSMSSGEN